MQEFTVAVMCTLAYHSDAWYVLDSKFFFSLNSLFQSLTVNIFREDSACFCVLQNWKICSIFFYLVVETKNNTEKSWAKNKEKLFEGFCDSSRVKQMIHIVNAAVYINFYGSNEMERAQSKTLSVPYDT